MHGQSVARVGSAIARAVENGDLESPCHAIVLLEFVPEHSWIFCLNALCNNIGMLVVGSAAAELNQNEVFCRFVSSVEDLLDRLFLSHNYDF